MYIFLLYYISTYVVFDNNKNMQKAINIKKNVLSKQSYLISENINIISNLVQQLVKVLTLQFFVPNINLCLLVLFLAVPHIVVVELLGPPPLQYDPTSRFAIAVIQTTTIFQLGTNVKSLNVRNITGALYHLQIYHLIFFKLLLCFQQ